MIERGVFRFGFSLNASLEPRLSRECSPNLPWKACGQSLSDQSDEGRGADQSDEGRGSVTVTETVSASVDVRMFQRRTNAQTQKSLEALSDHLHPNHSGTGGFSRCSHGVDSQR
eukprot:1176151-Prorocentrum_minimum.AAC.3